MAFKTQAEIYQALLDGKKIQYIDGEVVGLMKGTVHIFFRDGNIAPAKWGFYEPSEWSIYEEPNPKKKVTLYRYTYQYEDGSILQTNWQDLVKTQAPNVKIIHSESKEIEVDDV